MTRSDRAATVHARHGRPAPSTLYGGTLSPDDERLLRALADQLSLAIDNQILAAEANEAAALADIDAVRTAMLRAVSHDLRTPLASIKAMVSGLRDPTVAWTPDQIAEALLTVDEETDRLNRLVGNLLDASRLQIGTLAINVQPTEVAEVVAAALYSANIPNERVDIDIPADLATVQCDSALLERSLANILTNAERFSPLESPVRIEAAQIGNAVHIRIVDRGPGINPGDRDHVIQPFQRLGDVPVGDGVGLGLSIANGFVTAMGGTLLLDDTPGGGLTVTVVLPRSTDTRNRHSDRAERRMTSVLIVDDERQIRRALSLNFGARGYQVHEAATGEAALTEVARVRPDIVLLDLGLPGMSGLTVLEALRGWTDIPIIVLTARDEEASKVLALDAGADDYVTKPFGMAELVARVRAALRRSPDPTDDVAIVRSGQFDLDLAAHRAFVHTAGSNEKTEVRLTPTEWAIVIHLVRHPQQLVTYKQLIVAVWGPDYEPDQNLLRVHMGHIRRKLESDHAQPEYFITDAGVGYRFQPEP